MSNKSNIDDKGSEERSARYEFRVWGKHRAARKQLERLATVTVEEEYEDCYLLVDDPTWNAKVRDNTLKIKHLVAEKKGFEQWASGRYHSAKATPSPFDDLFDELRLDRPQRGKKYNLPKEVRSLDQIDGVRAVFVSKNRRRYTIGDLRAEVTDIEIHDSGEKLRTLSIQGDDLKELRRLRKRLGLGDEPNVAMHQHIDAETAPELSAPKKKA